MCRRGLGVWWFCGVGVFQKVTICGAAGDDCRCTGGVIPSGVHLSCQKV